MKTYIHVNPQAIRDNNVIGRDHLPVITVMRDGVETSCQKVRILGPSEVLYSGTKKPLLPCGVRVAVVTESEIVTE